jgi:guanylate kinase
MPVLYRWFSSFDAIPYPVDVLRRRLVIIAGPSGAGKTALASALSIIDHSYVILRNYTTRAPRSTDRADHFSYLSEPGFLEAHAERQFFLARLAPPPRYGYKAEDVVDVIAGERRPLLMFRHSGTKYMAESVGQVPTVFIEGEPKEVACHSRNKESPPTEEEVKDTITANRQLQDLMAQQQWPWFRVTNHYDGDAELHAIAQAVREFLSAADGS